MKNNQQEIDDAIEEETGNEDVQSEIPFNSQDINIKIIQLTVGQLIDKLEYNEIQIPDYQRLPNLWNIKQKSRFIESLILKLPIPLFYFDEREKDIWWAVDGLQRITTINEFVNEKKFKLQNLEFLIGCNNMNWDELSRDVKRNITASHITINLIQKGTPEEVKLIIYRRIKQNIATFSDQELRTALFWGNKVEFLKRLTSESSEEGKTFHKATDNGLKNKKRQEELDLVSRFLAFYLIDANKYEPDLDTFITKGMKEIPMELSEQNEVASKFKQSMVLAHTIFGNDAFRKRNNKEDTRKSINKPLFEIISVYFAKLNDVECKNLTKNKDNFIAAFIQLQQDSSFWSAITNGTYTKENVKKRHTKFKEILNQFIK